MHYAWEQYIPHRRLDSFEGLIEATSALSSTLFGLSVEMAIILVVGSASSGKRSLVHGMLRLSDSYDPSS